jgi:mannan endo-1,4-beta-mannosidase
MAPNKDRIVAMSENGEIPDPDLLIKDEALWSWFMVWNDNKDASSSSDGNFWAGNYHNVLVHKRKVMDSDYVITLDTLPDVTQFE